MDKTAQEKNSSEILSLYVVFLKALYLLHQDHHWKTPGYAEHLLFQRLYESAAESVDEAGERAMGLFNVLQKQETLSRLISKFDTTSYDALDLLESSLAAEKAFQNFAKKTYDIFKESGGMTLGLDDLIMSHANAGEVRIFLLQQAIKSHGKG